MYIVHVLYLMNEIFSKQFKLGFSAFNFQFTQLHEILIRNKMKIFYSHQRWLSVFFFVLKVKSIWKVTSVLVQFILFGIYLNKTEQCSGMLFKSYGNLFIFTWKIVNLNNSLQILFTVARNRFRITIVLLFILCLQIKMATIKRIRFRKLYLFSKK